LSLCLTVYNTMKRIVLKGHSIYI